MTYFPKSQIKTNLYTNGSEYILSTTKESYEGAFYQISNGNKYTGKSPQNPPNILLISINTNDPSPTDFNLRNNSNIIEVYSQMQSGIDFTITDFPINTSLLDITNYLDPNNTTERLIPNINTPLPSTQDNQNGQFYRYFAKKSNELRYLETDKDTYQKLNAKDSKIAWDLYNPVKILWTLKGNKELVYSSNKGTILSIEQNLKWYGFSQYFKDNYTKYYQSQDTNNLYTSGSEFTTKNGQNYIGFYHMHNGTIPMVGKTHINTPHDVLTLIKKSQPISQTTSSMVLPTTLNIPSGGGSYGGGGGSY
jgi:hypothetical protein